MMHKASILSKCASLWRQMKKEKGKECFSRAEGANCRVMCPSEQASNLNFYVAICLGLFKLMVKETQGRTVFGQYLEYLLC